MAKKSEKDDSAVRDAVRSGIAAMVIAGAGMIGALAGAYWFLILIAVGVTIFLVVLDVLCWMGVFRVRVGVLRHKGRGHQQLTRGEEQADE